MVISAAILQSQLIATLIAALDSAPALAEGGTIAAKITRLEADGTLTLAHPGGTVRLAADPASLASAGLKAGDTVLVSRETGPGGPSIRLTAIGQSPAEYQQNPAGITAQSPSQLHDFTGGIPAAPGLLRQAAGLAAVTQKPFNDAPNAAKPPQSVAAEAITPELIRASALRQNGLGPLFAALSNAVQSAPETPLARLAAQLLAARLPGEGSVEPPAVKTALVHSGILLEAKLAAGDPRNIGPDRKALLLAVREAAAAQAGSEFPPARAASVRPPLAGLPPETQEIAKPPVPSNAGASEAAAFIRDAAGAGLERIKLQQFACLPLADAQGAQRHQPPGLTFEIPIALGRDTAIADFRIEAEGGGNEAQEQARQWRVKFAIDLEGTGPLHAEIALTGQAVSVSLWADQESARDVLTSGSVMLRDRLADSGISLNRLEVRAGKPPVKPDRAGRIVDHLS